MSEPVRLTQFARGGGCAAKLRLGELARVLDLAGPTAGAADVLVAHELSDDAAVVRTTPGTALVLTTDVIAPLVDDPETFGAIAATNAMSDVWAMGGTPRFALNLAFFDTALAPIEALHGILRGGARACAAAGVAIVGGHTVCDPQVKYGLAVTGEVDPQRVLANTTAEAGQALVLTKALGTGVISQATKAGVATADELAAAVASMTTGNGRAVEIARRHGVTAATDVTGFGLCGHLRNLARGSRLAAVIELDRLPLLPGADAHLAGGRLPGGSRANRAFMAPRLRWADGSPVAAELPAEASARERRASLACDAQTSGGLLLCLPAAAAADAVAELRDAGLPAEIVGALRAGDAALPVETIELR
ncbi:MAG: selenide, water dikinase SelD [Kofleriaceae bacterium]